MKLSPVLLLFLIGSLLISGGRAVQETPPSDDECSTCVDFYLIQDSGSLFAPSITTEALCKSITDMVINDVSKEAKALGIALTPTPERDICYDDKISVCFDLDFAADGEKLQPYINEQVNAWWAALDSCSATFYNWHVSVMVGGDGCIETPDVSPPCPAAPINFPPNCSCDTGYGASPIAVSPVATVAPGKAKNSTLYCFSLEHINTDILDDVVGCTSSTAISKVEMLANEAMKLKLRGVAARPSDSTTLRYLSASWGSKGGNQLKITPLNWSKDQTDGAEVCLELDASVTLHQFCLLDAKCMLFLFDDSRKCCPGYPSSS